MENIQIFTYSLIQGITEFLPISSSAHLYLIQNLYKWTDNALLFALGAHLGTFLALIFFIPTATLLETNMMSFPA